MTNEERVLESDEEFVLTTSISEPPQYEDHDQNIFDYQGIETGVDLQDNQIFEHVELHSTSLLPSFN